MKKCLFFAMFLLLIVSCKKDRFFDEYGLYGEGTALLNGHPWRGQTFIGTSENFCSPTDTCYTIQLAYFNQYDEARGRITFNLIPLKLGRHTFNYVWPFYEEIENRLTYSEWGADGDVITGSYHVFEQNDDNYVELT